MAGATHAANRFEVFPLLSAIVGGRETLTRQVQKDVALFALLGMTIELLRYIPGSPQGREAGLRARALKDCQGA